MLAEDREDARIPGAERAVTVDAVADTPANLAVFGRASGGYGDPSGNSGPS